MTPSSFEAALRRKLQRNQRIPPPVVRVSLRARTKPRRNGEHERDRREQASADMLRRLGAPAATPRRRVR